MYKIVRIYRNPSLALRGAQSKLVSRWRKRRRTAKTRRRLAARLQAKRRDASRPVSANGSIPTRNANDDGNALPPAEDGQAHARADGRQERGARDGATCAVRRNRVKRRCNGQKHASHRNVRFLCARRFMCRGRRHRYRWFANRWHAEPRHVGRSPVLLGGGPRRTLPRVVRQRVRLLDREGALAKDFRSSSQ